MRRVVVTGMGMVTPLGCGVEPTWQRLVKGESGAKKIDTFEGRSQFTTWAYKIAVRVALNELRRRRWRDVSLDGLEADDPDTAAPRILDEVSAVASAQQAPNCPPGSWFCADAQVPGLGGAQITIGGGTQLQPLPSPQQPVVVQPPPVVVQQTPVQPPVVVYQPAPPPVVVVRQLEPRS